ncbi:glycosyltransferase family 9 protein [Halomonas sp. CUBES01]|uniref:Glycosyltransferase family 9 protein n=1 Tax=Vreelandella gomseomensis TaxID=370766 RepID=A0ABU1GBF5_9GAMM|nr:MULTISPECIES: glycosyltransferase family 9 protein [Halomonas]MDR5874409.1 glycosyltransferase family 9 protein [Halomonas gomseomensis]MEC4765799.1 glycosyltransferase family 9 protein [Halomonas sp. CUBES01]
MSFQTKVKCIAVFLHNRPFFGAHVVHAPFLSLLKERYPHAMVVGISRSSGADFLVDAGFLDAVEVLEKSGFLYLNKKYKFDMGFNLRPSSVSTALLMLALRIPRRVGFKGKASIAYTKSYPLNTSLYRADLFLSLLNVSSSLEACPYVRKMFLHEKNDNCKFLIAPGAGGEEKKWPLEYYIELADMLSDYQDKSVCFITGPQEEAEKKILEKKGFNVVHNASIVSLFSLIRNCEIFISNDCGPSHVAHIMGVKQVVIFKKYLPEWFLERGNSSYLASENNLAFIKPSQVMEKFLKLYSHS